MMIRKLIFLCIEAAIISICYGKSVPTDTTTPVCADNEKLFQLRLITAEDRSGRVSYRVFTESTGVVHAECTGCYNVYPGADVQLCLPLDGCHTFAIGQSFGPLASCYYGHIEQMVVSWGGETLRNSNAYNFDSVNFGEGCKNSCESEFEFFLEKHTKSNTDPFSWSLNDVASGDVLLEGQAIAHYQEEYPYDNGVFVYERTCVSSTSCLEFYMGYPSNTTNADFYDASPYSIRLDGVVYREDDLGMGIDLFMSPDKLNETVHLGHCAVNDICNATTEDLVEVNFTIEAMLPCEYSNNFDYSSAILNNEFIYVFKDAANDDYEEYYDWIGNYEYFEVNRTYATKQCIPNDKCAEISFETDNPLETYSIFQNGGELTERSVYIDGYKAGLTETRAGSCRSGSTLPLTLGTLGRMVTVTLTMVLAF